MKKSCRQQELCYDCYDFTMQETIGTCLRAALLILFLAELFYRSLLACIPLSPLGILVWQERKKRKVQDRKKQLSLQFKDCIQAVSANLKAGYSVENAFRESLSDIRLLHGDTCCMAKELSCIMQGLANHVNLEELLLSLGKRSSVTDIREFAEVFAIAKRNGGNMTDILMKTSLVIGRKMEVDREIHVLLSAKRMEQQIMNLIPFAIILYISLTSPGFFDVLYHNIFGVIIMTSCLLVYFAAYRISSGIMNISTE